MPSYLINNLIMIHKKKYLKLFLLLIPITFFNSITIAEDEEVYLQAISDQIQVITKDLKTLENTYQKSKEEN